MARSRVRNIVKGGGKNSVQGFKELKAKLQDLQPENPTMRADIQAVLGDAAVEVRNEMRAQAMIAGWPARLIATIFKFSELRAMGKEKISALAGVSKKRSMLEWKAGKHPKSQNAKVPPGGKVAESLATMYEFGTSRMSAHPAIRPAVKIVRNKVREAVKAGMRALLEKYANG